jgi:hypothetical protein
VIKGNLEVPVSVTLRGEWRNPENEPLIEGTVLMAYADRGQAEGAPFITVDYSAGVKDLAIWYPEQNYQKISPYPYTLIQKRGNNATFENLTLVNSYQGVKIGPESNECHYLHNVYGTPLKTGVWYDSTTDIGRLENINFSPRYWIDSGLPGAPTRGSSFQSWLRENGTALHMLRSDWEYVAEIYIEGYATALLITQGARGAANAQFEGLHFSKCRIGIDIEKTNPFGMVFSRCQFDADLGVKVREPFDSAVIFSSCTFKGPMAFHLEGNGNVAFQSSTFDTPKLQVSGGMLAMTNCNFIKPESTIYLSEKVKGVSLIDLKGEPRIDNPNNVLCLQPEHLNMPLLNLPDYPNINNIHQPKAQHLFVATDKPWGLRGDGKSDNAVALQKVLDAAFQKGGGIVLIPGGDYIIRGEINIPEGVELRGIHDVPHHSIGNGSVLHIYPQNNNPSVVMQAHSGLRGISFNYPEQSIHKVKEYPYLIQGRGEGIYVINVNCTNPYRYLDLNSYRCDRHYIDYLSGGPLKTGIAIGNNCSNGVVRNMQFNPHYWGRVDRKNTLYRNAPKGGVSQGESGGLYWTYQKENMDALIVSDSQNQFLFQNFVFGSLYGIHFTSETNQGIRNCIVHGHGTDGSKVGAYFEKGTSSVIMVNTELVAMSSEDKVAIQVNAAYTGEALLSNTMVWGQPEWLAVIEGGQLLLQGLMAHHHGEGIHVKGGKILGSNLLFANIGGHLKVEKSQGEIAMMGCITASPFKLNGENVIQDTNDGKIALYANMYRTSELKTKKINRNLNNRHAQHPS